MEAAVDNDERRLVGRAIDGDAQAFAALYDRHLDRVYRYVYYWVGSRPEAEDISQQVFMNAWQAIKRYRCNGVPFVAWLLKIAHNLVVSCFRQTKNTCYAEVEPVSHDPWCDPEKVTMANQNREIVRRAILRLKPDQQQVVVMRFIEHFDYADIAASVGKSEGTVRVIQHRALAELRRLLASEVNR